MKTLRVALLAAASVVCVSVYGEVSVTKYVRNGLVAHYDGIRNAGADAAHDPAATTWKDLSGNGYDLTAYRTYALPAWSGGNCAEWTNSAATAFACTRVADQYEDILSSTQNVTIEFVADATIPSGDKGLVSLLPNANDGSYGNVSWGLETYGGQIGIFRGGDRIQSGFTSAMQTAGSGTCAFTLVRASGRWYLYYKGELSKDGIAGTTYKAVRNIVLGTAGNNAGAGFVGKVYAVRIYNRALTADEINVNRVLDRVRFFNDIPEGYSLVGDTLRVNVSASAAKAGTSVSLTGEAGSWGDYRDGTAAFGEAFTVYADLGSAATHGSFAGVPSDAVYAANSVSFAAYTPVALALRAFTPTHIWDGTASGKLSDSHWKDPSGTSVSVPGVGDSVYVPAAVNASDTVTLTTSSAIRAQDLRLGRGFGFNGKVTLSVDHKDVNELTGDFDVLAGATLTHAANANASTLDNVSYRIDFAVGGSAYVDTYAKINADGKGYPAGKGPGAEKWSSGSDGGATHGGSRDGGNHGVCYGSVRNPVTLGSGGAYSAGGGAVHLAVTNAVTLNGEIAVRGVNGGSGDRVGAGGSVWISCASLTGNGLMCADGSNCSGQRTPGCGGRVSVVLTGSGRDFTAFDEAGGRTTAYGGNGYNNVYGGAGTVYRETAAQGTAHGTLIIDNRGVNSGYAGFSSSVTDAEVGDVIVRNGGNIRFQPGGHLTVYGNWTNGGTVDAVAADGTLEFAGTGTARITGKNTVGSFVCTAPDKSLVFDANVKTSLTVYANGTFTVRGTEGHPVTLAGDPADTNWYVHAKANVKTDLAYLCVTNSTAGGSALAAYASEDAGGNAGWSFFALPADGARVTWTGAASTDWYNAANWNPARQPLATDRVSVPGDAARMPTLSAWSTTVKSLDVAAGATVTLSGAPLAVTEDLAVTGTVTTAGGNVSVGGAMTILAGGNFTTSGGNVSVGGAFACTGSLVATDLETFDFKGGVSFAGGSFTCARSSVKLTGAAVQTVHPNGQTFYTLTVANTGGATFLDGFTANAFSCVPAAAATLTFAAGKTVTADVLTLDGGTSKFLTLASGTSGTQWNLAVTASQTIRGVTVSDSAATGLELLAVSPSTDGDNNTRWRFNVVRADWTGAADNVFTNAQNWSTGTTPDANTLVSIAKTATISVNDMTPVAVGGLVLDGSAGAVSLSFFTNLVVNGTLEVKTNATLSLNHKTVASHVTGAMLVHAGGVVTHAENSSATTLDNVQYRLNLTVDGDLTVYEGGAIHARYKGYPGAKGPSWGYWGGSHGGMGGDAKECYGSVRFPVTLGSGGQYAENKGGGAIRLTVGGTATVDGEISAAVPDSGGNSRMSAGGSVWFTCGKLRGCGQVTVAGGHPTGSYNAPGGGGRLALYLTGADETIDAFTAAGGTITAKGGAGKNTTDTSGAAGTFYLETVADGAGRGTLIIDNASLKVGNPTAFGSDVTDAEVGDVIIRNGGTVRFTSGGHLTVYGNWTNGGTVGATAGSGTLEFAGTGTARITGQNSVGSFLCTAPDKTLVFDANANNALTLYTGGALRLEGAEGHPVTLLGSPADAAWHVSLGADVTTPIFYVAVSNSVSDTAITAKDSLNLGGNVNWSFPKNRKPGDPIVWTGKASANWGDIANWDIEMKPDEADSVFIRASGEEGQYMPVLREGTTLLNNLTVEDGASLTLSGGNLTVTNAFRTVGTGRLVATGTELVSFPATNVTFAAASGFSAGSSRVTLCAEGPQLVDAHGARFYRFTVGGSNDVTFASDLAADDFRATATADRTLAFAAGATLTAGRLDLRGLVATDDPDNPYRAALTVCGIGSGDVWRLKAEDAARVAVKGVRVVDSDATAGETVRADATCVNVTPATNAGWDFGEGKTIDWIASSGSFGTAANWHPAQVPGTNDRAVVSCAAGVTRTVTFDTADWPLGVLEVGGGDDGGTVSLTVKNPWQLGFLDVRTNATVNLATTGMLAVAGNACVRGGGTITHEANPSSMTTLNALSYKLVMSVVGDLVVESGGRVTADNKGFTTGNGPGRAKDNSQCTAHGGKCNESTEMACYGSVVNPRDAGSGGEYTAGSGVIDLTVGGTLTVNGTVCSGGVEGSSGSRLGSAGSVLVHAGRLAGGGTIHANGCSCWWVAGRTPAAGGRVAVFLSAAGATFDAFEQAGGKVTAYGGCSQPNSPSSGYWNGAGTVYLAKPGEGLRGQVIVDNGGHAGGWTELPIPGSLNGDTPRTAKNFRLTVRNGGRLRVVSDMKVRDVDMATADATLEVNTNVLTITTADHLNRRGWAENCTVTSNRVGTVWGRVEWRIQGTYLIVR